jgi:flagellar biogenesis protein FliO
MIAASLVELFVRMLVSLGFTLALIAVCYVGVKRYTSKGSTVGSSRKGRPHSTLVKPGRSSNSQQAGMTLLARTNLSRSTSLVAVQFGQNVFLVAGSETAPATVLAQAPLATWALAQETVSSPASGRSGVQRVSILSRARLDAAAEESSVESSSQDRTPELSSARRSWLDVAREATVRQA